MANTRTQKSPTQRADDVKVAALALETILPMALALSVKHGHDDPAAIAAWEAVEKHGATIHRQSRLLAGKNRGG